MSKIEEALEIVSLIKAGKPVPCGKGPADEYMVALGEEIAALRQELQNRNEAHDQQYRQTCEFSSHADALAAQVATQQESIEDMRRQVHAWMKDHPCCSSHVSDFAEWAGDPDQDYKPMPPVHPSVEIAKMQKDFIEALANGAESGRSPHGQLVLFRQAAQRILAKLQEGNRG